MLKNLRVRTKLIAVLAVPLAGLIVMAAIGVLDRRADAAEARDGRELAELTAVRIELTQQLQLERTWTAVATTDPDAAGDMLVTQREATDGAVEAFEDGSQPARGVNAALRQQIDRVVTDLEQLPAVRESIDGSQVNPQVAGAYYSRVVLGLSDLATLTASAARGTDLQGDLASLDALGALKEATAGLNATVAQMLAEGEGRDPHFDAIANAQAQIEEQTQRFTDLASDDGRRELQTREAASDSQASQLLLRQITNLGPGVPLPIPVGEWVETSTARLDTLRGVEEFVTGAVGTEASRIEDQATRAARNFLFGAIAVVLFSVLLASLVARSIARPLSRLTEGAYRLSEERLPALVEQLRSPDAEHVGEDLEPIDVDSRDEIGQLASAFNSIQEVTRSVASEQATLLRKGIGDIFVNLARRNQTLLDRQIEFIDQLEAREEDPDQLENLFKLDHLATRMRRNAESLLVLAGAEAPRRRGRPVDMADVVRVAIGEVEHFSRITLLALDDGAVSASVAVDLAHLLSELMENATQFSPPDTQVEIVGHKTRDGNYVLSVSDQGIGMSAEQLAEANRLMANPPVVGLALSRSLGFIVIGRLAARFGVVVRLTSSPSGGVSALVTLPNQLVDADALAELDQPRALPDASPDAPSDGVTEERAQASRSTLDTSVLDSSILDGPPFTVATPAPAATEDSPSPEERQPADEPELAEARESAEEGEQAEDTIEAEQTVLPPPPPPPVSAPLDPPSMSPSMSPPPAPPPAPPHVAPPSMTPPPAPPGRDPAAPPSPMTPPPPARPPLTPPSMTPPPAPPRRDPAAPPPPLPTRRSQPVTPDAPQSTVTAGGLTRRVPKAANAGAGAGAPQPTSAPVAATQRTPEEVRLMLSRYRSGLRRGRVDEREPGDPTPDGNES